MYYLNHVGYKDVHIQLDIYHLLSYYLNHVGYKANNTDLKSATYWSII